MTKPKDDAVKLTFIQQIKVEILFFILLVRLPLKLHESFVLWGHWCKAWPNGNLSVRHGTKRALQ